MDYTRFIVSGIILVANAAIFFAYVKFELRQLRKDMEAGQKTIEDKRLANVNYLKEIYNQKIAESRLYAKGLFDASNSEIHSVQEKMGKMDKTLDQILEILLKRD